MSQLKFSIRGLLLASLLIAFAIGGSSERWRRQTRVLSVLGDDVQISFDKPKDESSLLPQVATRDIRKVICWSELTQAKLNACAELPRLRRLELMHSGAGLDFSCLARCTDLETVCIKLFSQSSSNFSGLSDLDVFVEVTTVGDCASRLANQKWLPAIDSFRWFGNEDDASCRVVATALSQMQKLEWLTIKHSTNRIDDDFIGSLSPMRSLRSLAIASGNISSDCIAKMQRQPSLRSLSVSNWSMTPKTGSMEINLDQACPQLQNIDLSVPIDERLLTTLNPPASLQRCKFFFGEQIEGPGLATFANAPNLRELELWTDVTTTQCSPLYLEQLPKLENLQKLRVSWKTLGPKEIRVIKEQCPNLRELSLEDCGVLDGALAKFLPHESLETLTMTGTQITDDSMERIVLSPNLSRVELPNTISQGVREAILRVMVIRSDDSLAKIRKSYLNLPELKGIDFPESRKHGEKSSASNEH